MDQPQATQPGENTTAFNNDAEAAYRLFIDQVFKPEPGGFVSGSDHGKIFSFETFLREKGYAPDVVQAYCHHIKTSDYTAKLAAERKAGNVLLMNYKPILTFFLISLAPGILLFVLVAAFLSTFDLSIWNVKQLSIFALTGPLLAAIIMVPQYIRARKNLKSGNTSGFQYVIKYFDDDELTFAKAKSRLFVEK